MSVVSDEQFLLLRTHFAETASGIAVYGAYTILLFATTYTIIDQGLRKSKGRRVLLAVIWLMYINATIVGAVYVRFFMMSIDMLQTTKPNPPTEGDFDRLYKLIIPIGDMNYILGDAVVVWRAWVLYPQNPKVRASLAFCMVGTSVATIINAVIGIQEVPYTHEEREGLETLGFFLPLLATNLFATGLVAYRVWQYRMLWSELGKESRIFRNLLAEKALIILLESGILFCVYWVVAMLSALNLVGNLAHQLLGLYLTLVILAVTYQKRIADASTSFDEFSAIDVIASTTRQTRHETPLIFARGQLPHTDEERPVELAQAILNDPKTPDARLILADIVEPAAPSNSDTSPNGNVLTLKVDLTQSSDIDTLFKTKLGVPDAVYCMHGIMSRGSEDKFDFALKVNVDSVRDLLQAARRYGHAAGRLIKFIFTSSLAVYGGPLPDVVVPSTIATPEGSYGMGKLCSELFINEFTRRGFVDGRILRLPTVTVRPGAPAAASSSFISGIIREPMQGLKAICPIGDSLDSSELDIALWISSPKTVIKNLVIAKHIPADKFLSHTRVVCVPGITTTVRGELEALKAVSDRVKLKSGEEVDVLSLVEFRDDPMNRRIVASWPSKFDNSYALNLGFMVDSGGMIGVVEEFKKVLEGRMAQSL
ncbi:hypothetical protein D9758_009960 [Tetrapyrgos nigripes]|uniref:NAD-dependent epimerase/dehydratase domain-containing protein n=1 Tax=Tetrapyrgos nigripes TaxID=182062 RepID=A0A8H5CQJ9_9AGAR|nr:hypothetical protein D9758_009960 [Tetrapyrgos nigripes]